MNIILNLADLPERLVERNVRDSDLCIGKMHKTHKLSVIKSLKIGRFKSIYTYILSVRCVKIGEYNFKWN